MHENDKKEALLAKIKVSPPVGDLEEAGVVKHEIIRCERCQTAFECKANAFSKCQCSTVQLNLNEVQYVSENYESCLCSACLMALRDEFQRIITSSNTNITIGSFQK